MHKRVYIAGAGGMLGPYVKSLYETNGEDGSEKWGPKRTIFDTQDQSFYGLLNQVYSIHYRVLDPAKYFFRLSRSSAIAATIFPLTMMAAEAPAWNALIPKMTDIKPLFFKKICVPLNTQHCEKMFARPTGLNQFLVLGWAFFQLKKYKTKEI
jgi:hypothetical protein